MVTESKDLSEGFAIALPGSTQGSEWRDYPGQWHSELGSKFPQGIGL